MGAGPGDTDLFSAWVDPVPGTDEAANAALLVTDQAALTAGPWHDGFAEWWPRGGDRMSWDEIRFGETFLDVVPTPAVIPEQSGFVLAALGLLGLGMFVRRRRR